jgi:hypothetical protein
MRTATITAINKSATPWTVSVNISETIFPDATLLGWLDPQVGDVVKVLQQGSEIFILGPMAPGKVYMPPAPPPPPPPPAPEVIAPPPPPVTRTVAISAVGSGTGPAEAPQDGWRHDRLYQGGYARAQRSFWWYGNQIADAKGGGTIIGGTIFIKRWDASLAAGVNGGANVRLGGHGFTGQPGNFPGAHAGVSVVGQLGRGQGVAFGIPGHLIDGMNNGSIKGFGLEPGQMGYTSPDYLVCYPFGGGMEWSGSLSLTIRG